MTRIPKKEAPPKRRLPYSGTLQLILQNALLDRAFRNTLHVATSSAVSSGLHVSFRCCVHGSPVFLGRTRAIPDVGCVFPSASFPMKKILSLLFLAAPCVYGASIPQEYQAALKLYEGGRFAEARVVYEGLIALNATPQGTDRCLAQAAYCENQLKAHDKADALASKIKDEHLRTFCRMHLLTLRLQYQEVLALAKNGDFSTWPDTLIFEALMCRGNAYGRLHQEAPAEADYLDALRYTVTDYKKATVRLRLGALQKGQEALESFEEVMKLRDAGPTMRYQAIAARARILASAGNGTLALAEFERLSDLTKQPHWSMVQMARAATHETLGAPDKARTCYETVVASSNPPPDLLATAKIKLSAKP